MVNNSVKDNAGAAKSEPLKVLKALADQSRLLIVNALMTEPLYVEALAERLNLSASTVSFHLKKLEEAGLAFSVKEQYYVIYHLHKELFEQSLKKLIYVKDIQNKLEEERMEEYKNKIIRSFFEYGKLKSLPVQRKKRRIILEEIAKKFENNKNYSEKEVNLLIADFNDDFCTIRRDMISENLLKRENAVYSKA